MRQIAVVTGGSRGIGAACVEALAKGGWSVISLSRPQGTAGENWAQALRAQGLDVAWLGCDVTDPVQVQTCFQHIAQRWHHVDALVCNAGTSLIRLFQDTDEAAWDALFDVHVKGAYRCIQAVLPCMISRGGGAIITMSSMWGQVGASCEVAYSAAKAALIGMTKALAREVAPSGIRVNCVAPGVIDTAMNEELTPDTLAALAEEIPMGRIGSAGDVAETVRFLLSPGAAYITGQVIGVNGGMVT